MKAFGLGTRVAQGNFIVIVSAAQPMANNSVPLDYQTESACNVDYF